MACDYNGDMYFDYFVEGFMGGTKKVLSAVMQ
jgi:hypothetical protein